MFLETPWLIILCNRFFAAGKESLGDNNKLVLRTNSNIIELQKRIDGILLVIDDILTIWKLKASRLSDIL